MNETVQTIETIAAWVIGFGVVGIILLLGVAVLLARYHLAKWRFYTRQGR